MPNLQNMTNCQNFLSKCHKKGGPGAKQGRFRKVLITSKLSATQIPYAYNH
jgi:hypothetical protein